MDKRTQFSAPLSRVVRWVTGLTFALLLGVVALLVVNAVSGPPRDGPILWALAAVIMLFIPGIAVFAIREYQLGADELRIVRPGWESRVSLHGLQGVSADPKAFSGLVLRLFGIGGVFGMIGVFWSRRLGRFRAWVTDPERTVVLTFPDRTVLISPDDPAAFVANLRIRKGWGS